MSQAWCTDDVVGGGAAGQGAAVLAVHAARHVVSRLAVDRDGLLYVLEALDQQIRVYDGGELLRRIGRRGDGPGEFQRAARFGVKGDTVWVIEHLVPYEQRLTLCAAALVTGADVRSSGAGAGGDAAFSSSPRRSGSACPAPDIV